MLSLGGLGLGAEVVRSILHHTLGLLCRLWGAPHEYASHRYHQFFTTDVFGGNLKYILDSGIIRKVHESWCYWKNQGKVIFPVYKFFHYFYTVPFSVSSSLSYLFDCDFFGFFWFHLIFLQHIKMILFCKSCLQREKKCRKRLNGE